MNDNEGSAADGSDQSPNLFYASSSDEDESGLIQATPPRIIRSHKKTKPVRERVIIYKDRKSSKRRRRCCPSFPLLCCCGPCLKGCIKLLFLCGTLFLCAFVIGMIYIKSGRSCCGQRSDMCLIYAQLSQPDEFKSFISQFETLPRHKLQRAFDQCLAVVDANATQDEQTCYTNLMDCISIHANPLGYFDQL